MNKSMIGRILFGVETIYDKAIEKWQNDGLYDELANCHPSIKRGMVWCRKCGRTQKVNPSKCFKEGWPECCGATMTIDSPKERKCATH